MSYVYAQIGNANWYEEEQIITAPKGWALMISRPPVDNPNPNNYKYFAYLAQANGTWLYSEMPAPAKMLVWYDGKLQTDNGDGTYSPVPASYIPAKRHIPVDVTLGTDGTKVVDLSGLGYANFEVYPQSGFSSNGRLVVAMATNMVAGKTVTISARRTKVGGTVTDLLASLSEAAAGETVKILVWEI